MVDDRVRHAVRSLQRIQPHPPPIDQLVARRRRSRLAGFAIVVVVAIAISLTTTLSGGSGRTGTVQVITPPQSSSSIASQSPATVLLPGSEHWFPGGVSCATADACMMVGEVATTSGPPSLTSEWWDGRGWTLEPVQDAATNAFSSVSCPAPTMCMAVGKAGAEGVGLAEIWNGHTWQRKMLAIPAGEYGDLETVSCSAPTACTAAGTLASQSGPGGLLLARWDGVTWSLERSSGLFDAVSCPTNANCFAVTHDAAESWDGNSWHVLTALHLNPAIQNLSLSCLDTGYCVAVGSYRDDSGTTRPVLIYTDHSHWVSEPLASEAAYLQAVSCYAPETCLVAGGSYSKVLGQFVPDAAIWQGHTLQVLKPVIALTPATPATPESASQGTASQLVGISCVTNNFCMAVGFSAPPVSETPADTSPYAEAWNGKTWRLTPLPMPAL